MIELKGCPFCGCPPTVEDGDFDYIGNLQQIHCVECGLLSQWVASPEQAAKSWNNRHPDEHQQAVIKAAVEAIENALNETVELSVNDWIEGLARHLGSVRGDLSPHLKALKGLIDG